MVALASNRFYSGQPVRLLVSILGWVHNEGRRGFSQQVRRGLPYRDLSSCEQFHFFEYASHKPSSALIRDANGVIYTCPLDFIAPALLAPVAGAVA